MRIEQSNRSTMLPGQESDARAPEPLRIDREKAALDRADDDGMAGGSPNSSGADRVRAFIARDALAARGMLYREAGNNAHDRKRN